MTDDKIRAVVLTTLTELGLVKPFISQSEAFRRYGRRKVERWQKQFIMETTTFKEALQIVSKEGLRVYKELDEGDNYLRFENVITTADSDLTVYARGGVSVNIKTDNGDYYTAPCVTMTTEDLYLDEVAVTDANGDDFELTGEQQVEMRSTLKRLLEVEFN